MAAGVAPGVGARGAAGQPSRSADDGPGAANGDFARMLHGTAANEAAGARTRGPGAGADAGGTHADDADSSEAPRSGAPAGGAEPADTAAADPAAAHPALPAQLLAMIDGAWATPAGATMGEGSGDIQTGGGAHLPPGLLQATGAAARDALAAATARHPGLPGAAVPPLPDPASLAAGAAAPVLALADAAAALDTRPAGMDAAAALLQDASADAAGEIPTGQPAPVRAPSGAVPASALAAPLPMPADPDAGFDDGLGTRIGWMAGQQLGRAEIRVSPDQLGTIDVRLDLDGSRVSVELSSASHEVRQALESSLARLREMLAQQGLDLARADVGDGRQGGANDGRDDTPAGAAGTGRGPDGGDPGTERPVPVRRLGLLDEYA